MDNEKSYITADAYAIIQGVTYEIVSIENDYLTCKALRNPEKMATLAVKIDTDFEHIKKLFEFYTNKIGVVKDSVFYKKLLEKYIAHIIACEGVSYTAEGYFQDGGIHFTEDELKTLDELA